VDSLNRLAERGRTDRAELDALLDEVPFGTLATVDEGMPWVVPLLFARDGDRLLLHGSTGAGALRRVADGAPVAFSVTAFDGLVVAHSTFDSSANYRSAVLRGRCARLRGDDQQAALDLLSDRLLPGRTREVRRPLPKEWAATVALALPIEEGSWLLKVRTGGPTDPEEGPDRQHGVWRGVVPARVAYGPPRPAADSVDRPLPASVRAVLDR
jgi:nitroimidazol reductase NimA-like FMN-containing flavoprotein (pyridoxamine 5'-phosphate oxidase superfamily)